MVLLKYWSVPEDMGQRQNTTCDKDEKDHGVASVGGEGKQLRTPVFGKEMSEQRQETGLYNHKWYEERALEVIIPNTKPRRHPVTFQEQANSRQTKGSCVSCKSSLKHVTCNDRLLWIPKEWEGQGWD